MIIPEYVASQQLNTDRQGMPQPVVRSGIGEGLQALGSTIQGVADYIAKKQDEKDRTSANYAYEDWQQRAQVEAKNVIDNAPEDGSGVHNTVVDTIQADADKVLATLPDKHKEEFKHKTSIKISDHSIASADAEYSLAGSYHAGKIDEIANKKAGELTADPGKYKEAKDEAYKYIDDLPLRTADKAKLKKSVDQTLANGKFEGDLNSNPADVANKLGVKTTNEKGVSESGGMYKKMPSGEANKARLSQLKFAWHELNSVEKSAGKRLANSGSLEEAVHAGLAYERPSLPAYAKRLEHARNVYNGKAPPEAMNARQFFESQGMSPIAASGFVGVLMGESGSRLDPGAHNPKDPGGSDGIAQWNGPRKKAMYAFTGGKAVQSSGPDDAYANMSVEWKIQKSNQADVRIKQQEAEAQNQAKIALNESVPYALANIEKNGQTDVDPTYEQFMQADPETADKKFAEFQSQKKTAEKVYSMQMMSNDDLDKEVERVNKNLETGKASVLDFKAGKEITDEAHRLQAENTAKANQAIAERDKANQEQETQARVAKAIADAGSQKAWENMQFTWNSYIENTKEYQKRNAEAWQNMQFTYNSLVEQDKATREAASQLKQLWAKDPFSASMYNPNVSGLWSKAAADPENQDIRKLALHASLEAQKRYGVPDSELQLLPTQVAKTIVGVWKNPDMPTSEKQNNVIAAINLAPDNVSKYAVFNQLRKEGLPSMLEGAVDAAVENRDAGVVSRLFEAGAMSMKEINVAESDTKINQAAYDILATGKGAVYYGLDAGSAVNFSKMTDGASLIAKAAKVRMVTDKVDVDTAIELAAKDLLGEGEVLDTSTQMGTGINIIAPEGVDIEVLKKGFNKASENAAYKIREMAAQALVNSQSDSSTTKVQQKVWEAEMTNHLENSTFVKVDGGYALRHNATHLLMPSGLSSPNPMVFTLDQLIEMGQAPDTMREKFNQGYGFRNFR